MNLRRDPFQAIADPTRRAILGLVAFQALSVGTIADNFDSARQTISKHLQILHECELLQQTTTGREVYYQMNPRKMKEVADWLDPYRKLWEGRLAAMDELLNKMKKK